MRNSVRAAETRVGAGQADLRGAESAVFSQTVAAYMDVILSEAVVGGSLGADSKDVYVGELLGLVRRGPDFYLLDRLLVAGVVEARGCERFRLLAEGLDAELAAFYRDFAKGEARHAALFVRLAKIYFSTDVVDRRLDELLASEAEIVASLPLRPALH